MYGVSQKAGVPAKGMWRFYGVSTLRISREETLMFQHLGSMLQLIAAFWFERLIAAADSSMRSSASHQCKGCYGSSPLSPTPLNPKPYPRVYLRFNLPLAL